MVPGEIYCHIIREAKQKPTRKLFETISNNLFFAYAFHPLVHLFSKTTIHSLDNCCTQSYKNVLITPENIT